MESGRLAALHSVTRVRLLGTAEMQEKGGLHKVKNPGTEQCEQATLRRTPDREAETEAAQRAPGWRGVENASTRRDGHKGRRKRADPGSLLSTGSEGVGHSVHWM